MAMATVCRQDDVGHIWDFVNEDKNDNTDEPMLTKTGKDVALFNLSQKEEEVMNEQALQQIQVIDMLLGTQLDESSNKTTKRKRIIVTTTYLVQNFSS